MASKKERKERNLTDAVLESRKEAEDEALKKKECADVEKADATDESPAEPPAPEQ